MHTLAAGPGPIETFNIYALLGAGALLLAVVAARFSTKVGLPSLLFFLAGGVVLGQFTHVLSMDDADLVRVVGTAALVIILIEGGLATPWRMIRPILGAASSLSVLGVIVSTGVTAVVAHYALGFSWQVALLLGAVVASTDAAAVFSQLRRLPLPHRLTALLEAESGINDAPSVILVAALAAAPLAMISPAHLGFEVGSELVLGALVGVGVGFLGAVVLRRVALPAVGLYPLTALAFGVAAYGGAAMIHGSGFLACYLAALVIGNSHLPHRMAVLSFSEGLGHLAQIGMFTMLGVLVELDALMDALVPGLVIALVLLFLARPISVAVSLTPFRLPWREQAFLSWAGLRGAVPIVLATIPLASGVPGAAALFHVVFVVVVIDTLIQGPTLPWVAKKLGFGAGPEIRDLEFDSAPLEDLDRHMLGVTVPTGSALCGTSALAITLPPGAVLALVVHGRSAAAPTEDTLLAAGDHLVIVTPEDALPEVEGDLLAAHLYPRSAGSGARRWTGKVPA